LRLAKGMSRQLKVLRERALPMNIPVPASWIDIIDRASRSRLMDRSAFVREALKAYIPELAAK
jgi:metal-responsive CopG/Arc/MetJ family transcriptional regulator